MSTYDFFIAGRWRNKDLIEQVVTAVRDQGYTAFCFLENDYTNILNGLGIDANAMQSNNTEKLSLDHPLIQAIFEKDMEGQDASDSLLLVLPAGNAGHVEAGIAYGSGKKLYAVGQPGKTETLYRVFDEIFPDIATLEHWLRIRKQSSKPELA